jgi:hypothetical protein
MMEKYLSPKSYKDQNNDSHMQNKYAISNEKVPNAQLRTHKIV